MQRFPGPDNNSSNTDGESQSIHDGTFAVLPPELLLHVFSFLARRDMPMRVNRNFTAKTKYAIRQKMPAKIQQYIDKNLTLNLNTFHDVEDSLITIRDFLSYRFSMADSPIQVLAKLSVAMAMLTEVMEYLSSGNHMELTVPGEPEVNMTSVMFDEADIGEKRFPLSGNNVDSARERARMFLNPSDRISGVKNHFDALLDDICVLEESIRLATPISLPFYVSRLVNLFFNDTTQLHAKLATCTALIKNKIYAVNPNLTPSAKPL